MNGSIKSWRIAVPLVVAPLFAASCDGDPLPLRTIPIQERPALEARRMPAYDDPSLVRLDDRYDALTWQGGADVDSAPTLPGASWEFDGTPEGWSLEKREPLRVEGGALRCRSERGLAVLSPPLLGIRLRTARAIEIKMSVSRGKQMRLLWSEGDTFRPELSVTAELRPGSEPAVYLVKTPSLMGYEGLVLNRLRLEPTDEEGAEVAIDWIRILPREGLYSGLGHGLGREEIGNESRNVIYARTPASFSLLVLVPPGGRLDVGVGLLDAVPGARFRVIAAPTKVGVVVLDQEVRQDEHWVDLRVDLSRFAGRWTDLTFSVESERAGSVALWSNPAVYSATDHLRAPSVLVYLIDTLRADHVGAYGAANLTTPQIDRVAREGAVYLHCTAQAPLTRPSVASIMTSLYPPEHGVIDHGQGVSEGAITLAEQFRRYGYATAGFSASPHAGSSANLAQGFDQFLEPPAVLGASAPILDNHAPDYSRASAEAINARLLPWLARNADRPFFLYVHTLDPHGPYAPPRPYDALFDTGYRGPIDGSYDADHGFQKARTAEELARVKALYDGDIRCNDVAFGALLRKLEELGRLESTILIVTSDHGEEFREHGGFEHGQSLFQELLHVPWIVRWPSSGKLARLRRGVRIAGPVESIDIYPTLCAMAGVPAPPDVRGRSRLEELAQADDRQTTGPSTRHASLTDRWPLPGTTGAAAPPSGAPGGGLSFSWRRAPQGEDLAVSDGRYKLILRPRGEDLLFDLSTDPGELRDLRFDRPEVASALQASAEDWWRSRRRLTSSLDPHIVVIDPEERRWLEALGYVR